jgi:hypothetical protein
MANDIEFVDGLIVKAPHENAPTYVKASISIKVEDLGKWLREKYKKGEEWVNLTLKKPSQVNGTRAFPPSSRRKSRNPLKARTASPI